MGAEYTKERIFERIADKAQNHSILPAQTSAAKHPIDTSQDKFQKSAGLKQWAEIENLKIAAGTYSNVSSIAKLKEKIAIKSADAKASKGSLIRLEKQMKYTAEILKYADQYQENRPYQIRYRKSKNPDEYFRKHESQLILYDGAKEMLRRAGINLKMLDTDKIHSTFSHMKQHKEELQQTYKTAENEIKQMECDLDKLKQYLGVESYMIIEQNQNAAQQSR